MDPTLTQIFVTGGGWVVALTVAIIALLPKKGSLENARIDQLQEDLQDERAARSTLEVRVAGIDRTNRFFLRRDLAWQRHYHSVQMGVEAGLMPPWPEMPAILVDSEED